MAEQDSLKVYWDHFFKAETGAYEKSTWLDLFLAEFLIRVNNGADPKELINFCPVSGVVSLVGCELLCGIHRVTSSVTAHCAPLLLDAPLPPASAQPPCSGKTDNVTEFEEPQPRPEDPRLAAPSALTRATAQSAQEILRQYLLRGAAWKCLLLLRALGVEGLSCCRQLSSVLIWVFGELRAAPPRAAAAAPPAPPSSRTPIHQLFSLKIWSKQKQTGSQGSRSDSGVFTEKNSATGRSRHSIQTKQESDSKLKRKQSKHSDQSSESGDSHEDLQLLNRSLTVKVCTSNDDFEYFDSPVRSATEYPKETLYSDPFFTPRKAKPKASDYMNDKHKETINSEITTFEFTLLITDLLIELCKAESSLSGSEGSQISVQCINFSLRNLCSLQFGSVPSAAQCDTEEVSRIKLALTELLIVSLDKVLVHSDLCAKLINNGILPMLLRILEDVVCKSSGKYDEQTRAKDDKLNNTESDNLLKFVFGVAYSITAFFHCLLMQCRSVDKLRAFTDQFKLYGECLKGGLLKECIELMIRIPGDEEEIVTLIKKLVESIGKLIIGMKRVRSEVVHSAACPRSRHKACRGRVAAGMHHHHDILGDAGTGLPLASSCCISVLYGTLTSLVTDEAVSAQSLLRIKILRTMLGSGACCCFSPGFLMESVVRLMLTHNSVATLCLQLLEHTVYGELGASVLLPKATDQLPCLICEPCDDKRDLIRKYCPHGVSPVERKSVWSFLIHYNSLLQLDNHNNVLHATVSHLLRVTPKCRMEMKYELLFSVVYPTFIVAKHRYIIRMEEAAYFLTVSCLNIFSSLLNTVSFAEQFIQKGGLSYVLELVSLSEFSNQCCSILEIAIIVEIFKLMKESSDITYYREINSLASVQILFKSLSEMTEKCYKIYKLKLPDEKFEELCDVTKEREALAFQQEAQSRSPRKMSTPRPIKTTYALSENVLEESIENFLEILKNVWTFWKSCAGLCLYSPLFRQYVVSESVFCDSYALLKVLLYYLCHCESSPPEVRVLIKIVEALLTVQFAVTDMTGGRSKETSCTVLRAALDGEAALGRGGALRALCEALIRVSVARPSRTHAMPAHTHAKVPPLGCESGASSAAGSSSEDSASGPYASEHSEPARPDTGYEADVEIGKLEQLSLHKTKKISAMNNISDYGALCDMEVECAEYSKQGELAHPDLCVIVVDILTQLIHKLMTSPQESVSVGAGLATATLARACCTRLSGALLLAGAAPPRLLARLLAPPAAALLATADPQLQELQSSILELIHVVASQSISAAELAALLRLFTAAAPPLGALLAALQRLVHAATPATPDCILSFPIDADHTDNKQLAEELNYVMVNPATSQSQQAETRARKLQEAHTRAGIVSPWSVGAVRTGAEGTGWAAWLHGFGVLLWLQSAPTAQVLRKPPRAQNMQQDVWDSTDEWQSECPEPEIKSPLKESPTRRSTELSHVLSVGHDSLMLELWLDVNTGSLTLRLSRPEPGSNKVVSEGRVWAALPAHRWACLALNVTERVHKRRIHIQVTVFVNGCEIETVSLPLQGILVRKVSPTLLVAGHAGRGAAGAYHLSHVQLYRAPVFTVYTALHLTAHCPDHSCQVRCESPNYPQVLTPEVLDSDIDWDQVYEISTATLRELHDNLLLAFSAHAPNIMNLYHQTVSLPTVFAGRVASTGSLMGSSAGWGGASVPEALYVAWAGRPLSSTHRGLAPALYTLGGPDLLLYLFARVVELEGSAAQQAGALGVLLSACGLDARLHAALHAPHAHAPHMLAAVIASHKCIVSHHMLKVILEAACRGPVLTSSGGAVVVLARTDAVLVEPRLLTLLMRIWRQLQSAPELSWEVDLGGGSREQQRGSLWALALGCVRALLRPDHPRRAFNLYQLTRVHLLRTLLAACKERFLNSECGPLEPAASCSLVELVRGLMGAPPQLDRLVLLCDFLLLMHQASDTFVTHSRANFYFLLTPDTQESSEFPLKRRPSRRRHADVTSSSSATSDDVDPAQGDEADRRDSSDSIKQKKGIINSQIKEGRKHNVSSTSENSDVTIERSVERDSGLEQDKGGGSEGGRGAAPGGDYIVIEPGDLSHTTVDLYSSGIYHQRKVRAGAEPGWSACEGLLLLLRDTIQVLPEQALAQAVAGAIQAEVLVVLGNHRDAAARAAAVRAAAALTRRATTHGAKKFRAQHYYIHLANQISLYPPSEELAEACAALLTKCDVPLQDQLDEDVWLDQCPEAALRSPPLLALLPACVHDVPLAHHVARILARLIDKSPLKALTEVSAAEAVVRAVRAAGELAARREGHALLAADLHDLLARLAAKAAASPHTVQYICDMHHMLTYVEWSGSAGAARSARAAQVALFHAQLDHLEDRLQTTYSAHTKYANYFTTVLSSAVSLGSEAVSRAERSELASRHLATVVRCVAFLLTKPPSEPVHTEAPLVERLFATLLPAASGGASSRPKWWVGSGADWATALQELWWWAMAPAAGSRSLQPALLRALYHAPLAALHALAPQDPPAQRKLAVYLLCMLQHMHWVAEEAEAGRGEAVERSITDWARGWAVSTQAELPDRLPSDALATEAERLLRADLARWAKAAPKMRPSQAKVVWSKEALCRAVTEGAMGMTRAVVELQNGERKAFIDALRRDHSAAVAAHQRWHALIDAHTHERAVWHDPRSWPRSWQLDATEGPGRVRVRLRRAHLHVHPRFLKPEHRDKLNSMQAGGASGGIGGVVAGGAGGRHGLVARLQLNETVAHMARVVYVTVASDTPGELLLSDRCIHFVPEDMEEGEETKDTRPEGRSTAQSWPLEAVVQVATRRWCLQERAVELFLSSGHAHLIAFTDVSERTAFLKALANCHLPNKTEPDTLTDAMTQWRNGQITNWEYLMRLNGLAGRTYNDLMQYPVLPFVLADYSSRILDLNNPASFRDLTRPMAIQNKNREQHYINTYNDLKLARREGCSALVSRAPHHYASLYSNSGGVLHYLVRLPPFTQLFLNYQDNNFDMPDRTFHSLATTWRLITNDSPTDVKELIPELYYLPELFHNNEGLNLGVRQCGAGVDDVELPAWAADARLFTLIHRQALEAPAVAESLPHWIDLVFGYKQTGQAAIDAINVFPACTYYGFDPSSLEDEVDRTAAAAMVRTYGQAPRQLLRAPHPHRAPDLLPQPPDQLGVWAGVEGARWGRYCGSPALPPALVAARRGPAGPPGLPPGLPPGALQALPHPRAVAVTTQHTALLATPGDPNAAAPAGGALAGALALVSWGHSDHIVRLKRRRDAPPELLLHIPALDPVTCVRTSCVQAGGGHPIFLGHASGRVSVARVRTGSGPARARVSTLTAHAAPLADMHVSVRAGLLATASVDGTIVLWDLNTLSYIRTLPNRDMLPVSLVTISDTLCDVASVHEPPGAAARLAARTARTARTADAGADSDSYEKDATYKYKSLLRVHTVNARFVGSVKVSDRVTSICYSGVEEGTAVNCVACGLAGGGVRLYSSWDLRLAALIPPADHSRPLTSLTYSSDSSLLFGSYADGAVVAWESGGAAGGGGGSGGGGRAAAVRVVAAHALF